MRTIAKALILVAALACAPRAHAATGCLTGTYKTFNETWNQSGGDPVWSGGSSVGCQTWLATSGSNQSIVSAPSTGTCSMSTHAWAYSNVLELASGSTSATLEAFGTTPLIPSGSNTTITFEFCYSSTTVTNYHQVFAIAYPDAGSNNAFSLSYATSGSGDFYVNGGTLVAISAAVVHLCTIVLNGASSSFACDGTTLTTFTAPAYAFSGLIWTGDTGTGGQANIYIGQVTMANSSYQGLASLALVDGTGGTNGTTVTQSLLNGATHCGVGGSAFGGWAYAAGSSTDKIEFSNAASTKFASSLSVCGTAYSGNTGISIDHHILSGSTPNATATYTFETTYPSIGIGMDYMTNSSGQYTGISADSFEMGWFINNCYSTSTTACGTPGTNFLFCIEQSNPVASAGCVVVTPGNHYWITGNNTSTGSDTVKIYNYNASTGVLGSLLATFTPSDTAMVPGDASSVIVGAVGAEPPDVTVDQYTNNLIIELNNPSIPILPPTAPATGAQGSSWF